MQGMTLSELKVSKQTQVTQGESLPEFTDVALAEIDLEGRILSLNTFGKTVWGWNNGDKLPDSLFIALRSGEALSLTESYNGQSVIGTGVKREEGWLLVGYPEKNAFGPHTESSFRTLIENISPLNHPFIEQAPQGILFLDPIGNVIFANRQFRSFLNIGPTQAVSDNAILLFHFDDALVSKIQQLLRDGATISHEFKSRNSSPDQLRLAGSPVHDARNSILGAVLTLESYRLTEEVAVQSTHEVQDHPHLAPLKNVFISMMSHEIRTPLGVMNGYAEILRQELEEYESTSGNKLPPQIKEFAGAIHENAERLLRIVNEMFDLSNMRQLNLSSVKLKEVLYPLTERAREVLAEKGVAFDLTFSAEQLSVRGNEARLKQVFKNLLSNAVKFTHSGSVSVNVSRHEADEVVIEVADTGIGISQDYLDQLFTPFMQEDTRLNRNFAGIGLGLAVVKLLIDLMNGRIEVESEKGQGSTFRIFLPVA